MNHAITTLFLTLGLLAGCTEKNAAFCCIDPADCAAKGVDESRQCTDGLSCVDNMCVASMCATTGCPAGAPVCEVVTDVCVGCSDSTQCTRFPATDVCDTASGACVECMTDMDCDAAKPICDATMSCQTCKLDSECPSAACADDGTCVPESEAIYVSPTGTDVVPCSQMEPCSSLRFAVQQTATARSHIVFAPGNYEVPFVTSVFSPGNSSPLSIHGHGAVLTGTSDDGLLILSHPTTMRDVELINAVGLDLDIATNATVERVTLRGQRGLLVRGIATVRDVEIRTTQTAISLFGGSLKLDRVVVRGGQRGIYGINATALDVTNLVVSGTTEAGLELMGASGTLSFVTVADTGRGGTGPSAMLCTQANLVVSSSIFWSPGITARPTVQGGCSVVSSIVGPTSFAGAMNVDPLFENLPAGNFHLTAVSPARDGANAGPVHDFEGDSRPRGARFDIGADEAP